MHYVFSFLLLLYTVLQLPVETSQRIGEGIHPAVGLDPTGGIHVVFGRGKSILYTTSTDGTTFAKPVLVDSLPGLHLGASRGPQIAATAKSVVITAIDKVGNVWAYTLDRRLGHWQKRVAVTDMPDVAKEGFVAMAAGPDNSYNAVWLDLRGNQHNKLVGARSTDGGRTWSKNHVVYQSPDGTICECCQPSMVSRGLTVAIMFRNFLGGSRDMYVLKSADGGQTFGKAEKMGEGTWKLNACPMDGGGLFVAPDGSISTVWRRADKLFTARPGQPETELGAGKNAKIVATDKGDYVAFQRDGQVWATKPGQPQPVAISEGGYPQIIRTAGQPRALFMGAGRNRSGRPYSVNTTTINYMKNALNVLIFVGISHVALAQHQHHEGMAMPGTSKPAAKPMNHSMADTTRPLDHSMHNMNHSMPGTSMPGMKMDGSMGEMTMTTRWYDDGHRNIGSHNGYDPFAVAQPVDESQRVRHIVAPR